jgi:hypothetical protein
MTILCYCHAEFKRIEFNEKFVRSALLQCYSCSITLVLKCFALIETHKPSSQWASEAYLKSAIKTPLRIHILGGNKYKFGIVRKLFNYTVGKQIRSAGAYDLYYLVKAGASAFCL